MTVKLALARGFHIARFHGAWAVLFGHAPLAITDRPGDAVLALERLAEAAA